MSFRPSGALTLTAASIALMGGLAFAAVESIDAEPSPQVVIPAATQSDDSSHRDAGDDGDRRGRDGGEDDGGRDGADDPATHDAGDDHGGLSGSDGGGSGSSGSGGHGSDD